MRELKLINIEELPQCCRKHCCTGGIETCYLRELRRKFLDCNTQVERKRFLLNLWDVGSPSGFSIVPGKVFSQINWFSDHMALIFISISNFRRPSALLQIIESYSWYLSLFDFVCCWHAQSPCTPSSRTETKIG